MGDVSPEVAEIDELVKAYVGATCGARQSSRKRPASAFDLRGHTSEDEEVWVRDRSANKRSAFNSIIAVRM